MEPQAQHNGIPREVAEYWDARTRYYADPTVTRPPRNVDLAAAYEPRIDVRTFDRRKKDLTGKGKLGTRDWLEGVWPPTREWRPSWLPALEQQRQGTGQDDAVDQVKLVYEETYDKKDGKLVERRLLRTLGHLGAVAAMYALGVLDLSDGRLDGSFRVGRYLRQLMDEVPGVLCRVVT